MIKAILNNDNLFPYLYDGSWDKVSTHSSNASLIFILTVAAALIITGVILAVTNSPAINTFLIATAVGSFACLLIFLIVGAAFTSSLNGKLSTWAETRYGVSLTKQESKALLNQGMIELEDKTVVSLSQVDKKGQKLVTVDGVELPVKTVAEDTTKETSKLDDLAKAKTLLDEGAITQAEYDTLKANLLK